MVQCNRSVNVLLGGDGFPHMKRIARFIQYPWLLVQTGQWKLWGPSSWKAPVWTGDDGQYRVTSGRRLAPCPKGSTSVFLLSPVVILRHQPSFPLALPTSFPSYTRSPSFKALHPPTQQPFSSTKKPAALTSLLTLATVLSKRNPAAKLRF